MSSFSRLSSDHPSRNLIGNTPWWIAVPFIECHCDFNSQLKENLEHSQGGPLLGREIGYKVEHDCAPTQTAAKTTNVHFKNIHLGTSDSLDREVSTLLVVWVRQH